MNIHHFLNLIGNALLEALEWILLLFLHIIEWILLKILELCWWFLKILGHWCYLGLQYYWHWFQIASFKEQMIAMIITATVVYGTYELLKSAFSVWSINQVFRANDIPPMKHSIRAYIGLASVKKQLKDIM